MKDNRNRNRYKKKSNKDPGKTYSGSYRPSRNNRSQYPASEMSKISRRHDYLFDIYLAARKKYYDYYHRADNNQKTKIQKNYFAALKQLRDMERSLTKEQRYKLNRLNGTFKLDTTISSNSSDDWRATKQIEKVAHHILESQSQCDYSKDTEESSGNIDDYKTLKGIS